MWRHNVHWNDYFSPWDRANNLLSCVASPQLRGNHPCVLLAEQGRGKNFIVYKPNIGKQAHPESLDNLQQRYRKVTGSTDCYE